MKRKLRGCRAIVTGAACGIGRATAWELANNGVGVVVVDRSEGPLLELAAHIAASGLAVEPVVGDITDPQTRQRAIDAARSKLGGLDILVNNAGVGAMGLFEDADPQRTYRLMDINFFSLVEMTRLALPLLREGVTPMVVNVGSVCGLRGVPHNSEYCASKFAVHGFTESVRAEFSHRGIDVLLVCPGSTDTDFFVNLLEKTGEAAWPTHKPVSSARVAQLIVRAMRLGRHRIIPYRRAQLLDWFNRIAPRFVDWLMVGFVGAKRTTMATSPQQKIIHASAPADGSPGADGHGTPKIASRHQRLSETTTQRDELV